MSERMKRRKFLADALFATGALGLAALGSRYLLPTPEPPAPVAQKPVPRYEEPDVRPQGGAVCLPEQRLGVEPRR